MDLCHLIEQLSAPAAYPYSIESVAVVQTHISVVFLAGSFVYKIKKPVQLSFLDFSTLEKRRHFCHEEVRLNRRLAPDVYLDVVPVVRTPEGLRFEAEGDAIDWAVKMRRLPYEATLQDRLNRGAMCSEPLVHLAGKLAAFHAGATRNERIASFARFEEVARNARENFAEAEPQIGTTVSQPVFDRLRALTDSCLAENRATIERRALQNVPCDTHGDLRLDHVYYFPDRPPPGDLVIIDCIEFSDRFRFADPVADMAFLAMDLAFHGRHDLSSQFCEAYFRAAGDDEARSLLPFYISYRSAVRAKVHGLTLREAELSTQQRARSLTRARAHWLLALVELEVPEHRPALILVAGLPGVGKSTLAQALAERLQCELIRSDVVRKELSGASEGVPAPASFETGIYSPEWTERTYTESLRRAEALLFQGKRVIVDANFRLETQRRQFLTAATASGVPAALLVCEASDESVHARLQARHGDASDADWSIHQHAAQTWQEPGELTRLSLHLISTDSDSASILQRALESLRQHSLA